METKATQKELSQAREQGVESALSDLKKKKPRWPYCSTLGLSGKHKDIHMAWRLAKVETLEAYGHKPPKTILQRVIKYQKTGSS